MNKNDVFVELNEDVDRIEVHFKYDAEDVAAVKTIKGRRYDSEARFWTVPMDMKSARALRAIFGDRMQLGEAVRLWAKEQVKQERNMRQLNAATDAKLERTPKVVLDVIAGRPIEHPSIPPDHVLRRKRAARPYQRADIKLMSIANVGNFNDVGTGKTLEAIGAIYESEVAPKPILIVAPRRSLVNVWEAEFHRLSGYSLWTSESPRERSRMMQLFITTANDNLAIACIADDLRLEKYRDIKKDPNIERDPLHACSDYKGNWYKFKNQMQREFFQIEFGAFIIDEFHMTGLPNRTTLFHLAAQLIKTERKWPMSGTPIGGKPRRLWPILNFLDKKQYGSEWNWIEDWLEVTEEKVYVRGGRGSTRTVRTVGGIKEGTEEAFWNHHRMHMVRRTKKDALPGIPDAVEIIVDTPMDGKQRKDYIEFDENHEIVLDGKRLSGSIVLAQYTRLRQMANSSLTFLHDTEGKRDKEKPVATTPSNKLDYLLERLDENGIRKSDYEPGARAYIGVLDKSFLTVVIQFLASNGINCARLDGDTKDSKPLLDKFADRSEAPYVIAMTIQTGGTALNLERANSAHALDEAWDPDVMHQFFGRGDRGARETPLRCYTYRTPNSIQEYVAKVAGDKKINNRTVLNFVKEIEAQRKGQ
jgi:SNF2 family DNA or RNA helicase